MNLINSNIFNNIRESYFIKNKKIVSTSYRKKICFLKIKKIFKPINIGKFQIKIADTQKEIKKAQSLRYSIFYSEKKAKPNFSQKILRRDFDIHDKISDHLIIIDKNKTNNEIVGTYRLLRGRSAKLYNGFYSEKEFDLSNIKKYFSNKSILELGRSCIHSEYRSGLILKLLWQGIAQYINIYKIKVLIGCASFGGINIYKITNELDFLNKRYSIPNQLFIKSVQSNLDLSNKIEYNYCEKNIFNNLPPLIKGYLRAGGMVSNEYFIDYQFNTIDICILLLTENIENKYKKNFYIK